MNRKSKSTDSHAFFIHHLPKRRIPRHSFCMEGFTLDIVGPIIDKIKKPQSVKCHEHELDTVVHYTSLEALRCILQSAIADSSGYITLHLSLLTMMNDPFEGNFVLNRYLTNSNRKKAITSVWDTFYQQNLPFVFSTILSTNQTRDTGDLSMWKMYGDNFRGALIKFDCNSLIEVASNNGFIVEECKYLNFTELRKLITGLNRIKPSNQQQFLQQLLHLSSLVKYSVWGHEREFRIIKTAPSNQVLFKTTPRGIIQYVELKVPVSCVKAIMIGPKCDPSVTLSSLNTLKNRINSVSQIANFNIKQSTLLIR